MERKTIKSRMEEVKQRIYKNAQVQEGEVPVEPPTALLEELAHHVERFVALVPRIQATNAAARLPDGTPLATAIIRKDMLRYLHLVRANLADKAAAPTDRHSRREIKVLPALPVVELRRTVDALAREARLLEVQIQATNWATDLVDPEQPPARAPA